MCGISAYKYNFLQTYQKASVFAKKNKTKTSVFVLLKRKI